MGNNHKKFVELAIRIRDFCIMTGEGNRSNPGRFINNDESDKLLMEATEAVGNFKTIKEFEDKMIEGVEIGRQGEFRFKARLEYKIVNEFIQRRRR